MIRGRAVLAALVGALLLASSAPAQTTDGGTGDRPDEADLFGGSSGDRPDETERSGGSSGDRPDEADLFGGDEADPRDAAITGPASQVQPEGAEATDPSLRDQSVFDSAPVQDKFEKNESLDDSLRVGALFYQRAQVQHRQGLRLGDTTLSAPTLIDAYLDGRPTDRLRAFVSGRMVFDPTLSTDASAAQLSPGFGGGTAGLSNPSVRLDQAWLRFDILRTVFVTVGKQHVKWGTSRFFNPTDFITPERRDPLLVFDPRVAPTLVKFHLPWEARGWNFYAMALLDNAGPSDTLRQLGGATRAEFVVGNTEFGTGAVLQRGRAPRYAFDLSSALGPVDVYAELALQKGSERPLFRYVENPRTVSGVVVEPLIQPYRADGLNPSVSGGLTWTVPYSDTDTVTFGAEYFYNSLGANAVQLYPFLLVNGLFVPFYTGRHYAAAYAVLFGPGSWDNSSFVLSNLGNLTDLSFISRLDFNHRVLRDLSIEAFGAVHYGRPGEFRPALTVPSFTRPDGSETPAFRLAAPTFQLGVGLRLSI